MKVHMTRPLAEVDLVPLPPVGVEADVTDAQGRFLVAEGYATATKPPAPTPVPQKRTTRTVKPSEKRG